MSTAVQNGDRDAITPVRALADQSLSRAGGAPPPRATASASSRTRVRITRRGSNQSARRHIHFESYIVHEDDAGWMFADALTPKAREGVRGRLLVPNGTDIPVLRPLSRAGYRRCWKQACASSSGAG